MVGLHPSMHSLDPDQTFVVLKHKTFMTLPNKLESIFDQWAIRYENCHENK